MAPAGDARGNAGAMTLKVSGALEGLRVLDLTQMLAGPFATQMLADQGADVVKVEPIEGDTTRRVGPYRADDKIRLFGGYFASVNRNKRSLSVDLKSPEGKALFLDLVAEADCVVENFRAGVMDRLGLGYELLASVNPRLVYTSIRGFGDPRCGRSPYCEFPAYDPVAQAMGGIMGITGPDAATPLKVGPGIGDLVPAMFAAFGTLAAVWRAGRTGKGQYVDIAMVDCVLSLCERIVHQASFTGRPPRPEGNRHPLLTPFGLFPAADGFVTLAAHTDEFWATLTNLIGRADLISDQRTATLDARNANRDFVYETLSAYTSSRTRAELMSIFGGKTPFGPVYFADDILADPHFAVREMLVSVEHPGAAERVTIAGIPVRMTGTPGRIVRRAPFVGEDTRAVLAEWGIAEDRVDRLADSGSIRVHTPN